MQKITKRTRYIIFGAIILVVVIVVIIIRHSQSNNIITDSTVQNDQPTSTAAIGVALSSTGENIVATQPSATTTPPSSGSSTGVPIIPGPSITINLLTPIANNLWTIGQPNPIAWSAAANITGEIDLVDAKTKDFIGVIDSEIGPNQTSYIWDGRSIYLGRYSANKKDVVPGVYSIRIHFDGNGLGSLISGPITISD